MTCPRGKLPKKCLHQEIQITSSGEKTAGGRVTRKSHGYKMWHGLSATTGEELSRNVPNSDRVRRRLILLRCVLGANWV